MLIEGFAGSSFQELRLGCPGKGVPSAAMRARVGERRFLSRLCGRGRPLQEGKSADVVHEVHQADLRLGSDETDRAHDRAAHAGVLMAEDVLDSERTLERVLFASCARCDKGFPLLALRWMRLLKPFAASFSSVSFER